MDRAEIISMAFHLGSTISECEEFRNFQIKQSEVMKDAEAMALLQRFQEVRVRAVEQMKEGQEISAEEQKNLQSLENAMLANPLVKGLLDSQEKFNNLLNGVYYAIDQAINGSGCGGGCDSCGSSCC